MARLLPVVAPIGIARAPVWRRVVNAEKETLLRPDESTYIKAARRIASRIPARSTA